MGNLVEFAISMFFIVASVALTLWIVAAVGIVVGTLYAAYKESSARLTPKKGEIHVR